MAELFVLGRSLGESLKSRNETVSVAESSTGGLISAVLLSVPGASAYFVGGGVIYTRQARARLLSMPEGDVPMRGSTEEYALYIARLMRQRLDTTWVLAESGAAGPTGNRYGDSAGHSCIAVVGPVERAITVETRQSDREANMWAFTRAALDLFKATLEDNVRAPVPGVR
jgi:nicotinamide-nucleotide amidase